MRMKTLVTAATLLAATLPVWHAAEAAELRLATIAPNGHVWVKVAEQIKADLDARPDLDLQLTLFPGAQLGGEPETMQQLEGGLIDIGMFTLAGLTTRDPSFNAWFSPYLLKDVRAAGKARNTPAARQMLGNLSSQSMIGLGYVFAGMRSIVAREGVIRTAADIKGKKVRITPFLAAQTWWSAMGAVPTPIPLGSVYQAMQSGVVDAVDIDLDAVVNLSLQEVSSSFTATQHMSWGGVIAASSTTWDTLSDAQRKGLTDIIDKAVAQGIETQAAAEAAHLAKVRSAITVVELENGEAAFAEANKAFADKFHDIPLVKEFQSQVKSQ